MPNTPPPIIVWAEDVPPDRPLPRTDPPQHAHERATEVFDRIAGGTRTYRPARVQSRWRGFAVGFGLIALGGVVAWFRLDLGLLHVPTVTLMVGGLAIVIKALLGYR